MSCDSRHIVCGLLNKKLAIYDRRTLDLVQTLTGHTDHIWSCDMTKDLIVSGSWDGSVKLWTRSGGKLSDTYPHPDQREISGVRFSKDGNLIYVTCLSGSITILKVKLPEDQGLRPKLQFVR
jgi:WD40 repeat protein